MRENVVGQRKMQSVIMEAVTVLLAMEIIGVAVILIIVTHGIVDAQLVITTARSMEISLVKAIKSYADSKLYYDRVRGCDNLPCMRHTVK
mmetsp:Transcript_10852/g.13460  ORF Transcript_10852/g.13460 Transcript_10852/m.13460 type:complete len:90 (+) Transcript_10852:3093-3362(+)